MREEKDFDIFADADDKFIYEISQKCSPLSEREKERMFAKSEKKYGKSKKTFNIKVKLYRKCMRYKNAIASVACLILISGLLIFLTILESNGNSKSALKTAEKMNVSEISDSFYDEFEICKQKEYKNLDISECMAVFPDIDSFYQLEIKCSSENRTQNINLDDVHWYFDNGDYNNKSFDIYGSSTSIGEAVGYIENSYIYETFDNIDSGFGVDVIYTGVQPLDNDKNAYIFAVSPAWNNIPFDFYDRRILSDREEYYMSQTYLMMVRDFVADTLTGLEFPEVEEVGEKINEIYPLEDALNILSEYMTQKSVFEVLTAEFVYKGKYSEDKLTATLNATWKFTMYNEESGKYYSAYVDANSGEIECVG
ncbi:MAG: hypothetical protein IJP18_00930 [Oscillospiraceae bacterium]|nr:hypothetical protein [Oscillospiraceae bacterium]